jgi:Flp pilus assembly pilin Flp
MEYTLLLAFVTLGIAAILVSAGQSVNSIWTTANSHLEKGHEYAKEHGK